MRRLSWSSKCLQLRLWAGGFDSAGQWAGANCRVLGWCVRAVDTPGLKLVVIWRFNQQVQRTRRDSQTKVCSVARTIITVPGRNVRTVVLGVRACYVCRASPVGARPCFHVEIVLLRSHLACWVRKRS